MINIMFTAIIILGSLRISPMVEVAALTIGFLHVVLIMFMASTVSFPLVRELVIEALVENDREDKREYLSKGFLFWNDFVRFAFAAWAGWWLIAISFPFANIVHTYIRDRIEGARAEDGRKLD